MKHLSSRTMAFICLFSVLVLLSVCMTTPASAATLDSVSANVLKQMKKAPPFFKQVTLVVGFITTIAGVYSLYKGMSDTRSPTPWKTLWLILIGSAFVFIGSVALNSEATVFGRNTAKPTVSWTNTTSKLQVFP